MSAVHTLVGTRYSAAGGKTGKSGKSDLVAWRRGPEPRRGHSDDGRQSRCLGRRGCTARCGGVASEPSFGGAASHRRFGNRPSGRVRRPDWRDEPDRRRGDGHSHARPEDEPVLPRTCRSARRSRRAPDERCLRTCGASRVIRSASGRGAGAGGAARRRPRRDLSLGGRRSLPGHGQRDGYDRGAALDVGGGRVVETHTGEDSGDAVEAAAHRS